ncbi:MAG: hypothetical protein APF76_16100 [Desulfitibacter sp. BRH_c19]|nr:MAG: hypothetical protein APF76_16100 [Desulfitibacter sp. BRH_c19]
MELKDINYEEYLGNKLYKRTVERLIQLIVEVATNINNMLLKGLEFGPTVDYYSSFIELAEANVLPMEFALKIAPSTGLRNVIVHEYQKINDATVHKSIKETLSYYKSYMKYINDYLKT